MNIETARAEMIARMQAHAEKFAELGFNATVRTYFTDKALAEYDEFKRGCVTLWCELKISTHEMQDEDGIIYELYADIDKNGTDIKNSEPKNESEIEAALTELYTSLCEPENAQDAFLSEYARISEEFDARMQEFEKKITRLRYLSLTAVGVVILCAAIFFISSLL